MSESLRLYTTVTFGFEHTLSLVPPDAWDLPSPCAEWTVREVTGHAMGVVPNIPVRAIGAVPEDAFTEVAQIAGRGPLVTFRSIRNQFSGGDRPARSPSPGAVSHRPYDGRCVRAFMRSDTFVHTWDIARGAGAEASLDHEVMSLIHSPTSAGRFGRFAAIETAVSQPACNSAIVTGSSLIVREERVFVGSSDRTPGSTV